MKCTYYNPNKDYRHKMHWCLKVDRKITKNHYCNYCSNLNYEECPIYKKQKEENCLFTTILKKINQLSPSAQVLDNLSNFRKDILETNEKYRELLVCHDRISPIISDAIRNTNIKTIDEFLTIIYSHYITPINNFIINKEFDKAITRYKKMLELLIVNFSLGQEYAGIEYYYKHPEHYKPKTRTKTF